MEGICPFGLASGLTKLGVFGFSTDKNALFQKHVKGYS